MAQKLRKDFMIWSPHKFRHMAQNYILIWNSNKTFSEFLSINIYIYIYWYNYDFNLDLFGLSLSINFLKLVKILFKIELQLDRLAKYSGGVKTYQQFIMYNIIVIIKLQLLQASTALRKNTKNSIRVFAVGIWTRIL